MKLKAYYVFGLILLAFVGIAVGRYYTYRDVSPEHAILYDQSKSKIDGCSCLKNYARQLVREATKRDEKVTLYSLGTEANGYQPMLIDAFSIPKDDSPLGDRSKAAAAVENFLNTLEAKCKGIARSDKTPLVQGVATILEQLRSNCSPSSHCSLYVQTDLEEDVSPTFLEAFKVEKSGKTASNLERYNNAGIPVIFAGTAEVIVPTRNIKKTGKDKALQKLNNGPIWRNLWSRSFTEPELVSFQPICGSSTDSLSQKSDR
jgi:hypothetical protein